MREFQQLRLLQLLLILCMLCAGVQSFVNAPKIISKDGNLVFESGRNRNISFRLNGNSRLLVNGEYDVLNLLMPINGNKKRPGSGAKDEWTAPEDIVDIRQLADQLAEFKESSSGADVALRQLQNRTRALRVQQRRLQIQLRQVESTAQRLKTRLELDSCQSNPCENGGTCVNTFTGYRCQCRSAFEGSKCERDVNECALFEGTDLGCQNGGQCVNQFGSFSCLCSTGWHGMHCTQRKTDCGAASSWELCGHGSCVQSSDELGYRCICDPGWKSNGIAPTCTEDVDECSAAAHTPCSTKCINLPGSFTCAPCAPGLTGNGMSCRDINECETNNGGCSLSPRVDCINSYGSSHCGPCPVGWIGDGRTCQRSPLAPGSNPNAVGLTSCAQRSSVCHPLAICSEISNTIVCSCPAGMLGSGYGENGCVRGTNNNCNDMPCRNGGICVDNGPSNYTCTCLSGFGGRHCDPLPSVCSSNPCKNNGRCRSTPSDNGNGFVCQCQPGYRGRLCETRFSSCNAMLYGLTGRLRYPPGNGSYEHNAQCAWVIRTNESLVLNVTFQSFNLEDSSECRFDWLQINDGRSAAAQIIGRYCGNRLPHGGNLISSGNQLYLWFRSDNSTAYEGFDLTWQSMEPQCGGRYEFDTHGTLASPGSPGNYPRNRDCSWHLVAPNDKRIKLTFFSLQLEQHDTCNFDYVSITDAIGGRELHKFCTSEQPAPLLLPTHEAIVRFHSDNTSSDLGFQLHYSAEQRLPGCGGVYTTKEGRIVSPTLPVDNPQAISCDYEIRLALDETIRIEFSQFELATDDCIEIYDLLEATDAEPARNWLQSKHCGAGVVGGGGAADVPAAPLPPSITSRGNRVRIRYYASITSAASNHFQLIYRTDCSHTYNAISGNFTSPGYPNLTQIDGMCSYKIHTAPGTVIQLRSMDFNLHTGPDVDGNGNGNGNGDGDGDGYRNYDSSEEDSDEVPHSLLMMHRNRQVNAIVIPPTCNPDDTRVTINDGINHNVLGPFCGSRKPAELYVSKTNMLTIQLSTGSGDGILGRGFHFQYTTVQAPTAACGGVHTLEGQNIRVPVTGSGHYEEDMKCTWVIMAPPGKFIMLHWISFDMEGRDCRFDFVEIYDELPSGSGSGSSSNPLKTYCGTELPQDMVTQSRMITVKFQSDFSESGDGFELSYRFMDRNECGGNLYGVTGMVMSPGYPLRYAGNLDCIWILNVPQSERLEVQRELFELHATQNCSGDWVEVRNGGSKESPLLGRFCGDNMPRRIPSFTNQLYIHFHTDSVGTGRGFRFAWRVFASGCGGRLFGNAGVITSPNYPQPYPHHMHCEWQLRAPLGSNLRIQLEDVDLEDTFCYYDYLQLEPIQSNVDLSKSSRPICMLPPKPENRILDMGSSLARIIFHSDVSEASKGFRLSYSAICDRELLDMHGIIESINYGEAWYDQETLNCSWRIRGPRGNHVLLEFSHFDQHHQQLVPTANDGGGVYVMEGNATSSKKITRIVGLGVYNSSSDFVTIVHNSSSVNFRMEYRIEGCLHEMREETGSFHSLNYPNVYPNDVECLWLIHASEGHVIELTVAEMDIEESINCTKDALVISNSNTQGLNPRERHCGSKGMQIFTSAGPKFYVYFKTDGSHNGRGFEATYRIVKSKCGGKLIGTKGTIESPGYPQLYPPKTECEWIIEVSPHHTIIFELEDMDIESAFECIWDHVTVYDLSASDGITDTSDNVDDTEISQIFRLCGSSLESSMDRNQSTTNRALVRFQTDDSNQRRGFRLHYHESCGQTQSIDETDYQYIMLQRQVPSNESCVWVLRANDPGKHIIFTPTHVQLYPHESDRYPNEGDCMAHGVKIYEGVTATGTPRLQFCRSHPPALISVGAALTISVPLALIADFEGHFMTMDVMCGSTYDALTGRFTSPYYPSSYPVNIECVWVIEATAGNSISLTLESFDMEESDGCNNDYLEIREESERGPLIGVYCGKQVPPAVHSKGSIWMKFKSNDDVVGEGFIASYNYELHNELNGTEGEVTSPRYPSNFLSPVPYTWRITVDPDYVVVVNVDHLRDVDMEHVRFYDGYTDIGSVMQPRSEQPSLVSNTNVLYMKATRGPFKLSWTRLAKTALADNRTAELQLRLCGEQMVRIDRSVILFKSPGYPGGYEADLNCSWIIMSNNPAMHASLQLTTVDLEQFGDDCYTDYLRVSSSNNMEHWTELAKLCRPLNESQTYQGTPYLRLQFITDTSVNKTGFSSILRSVCGSELTASQGIVNITEMGPQRYLSSADCVWTIRVRQGRRIRITFLESQLNSRRSPNNGDCPTFFVVRNGFADDSPFLGHGKYCENNITDVLETTSNRAYIKFHRRNILDYRAAFRYEEISNACSNHIVLPDPLLAGSYNLSEPVISSPNYPNLPNPHSECVWRISAPLEHRIALEFFGDFNLSPASETGKSTENKEIECSDEFVQVNDGSTELMPQLGRFCGATKPDTILSSGSEMRVKFYTGVLEPHVGFQARLRLANCGGSYYSEKGIIRSPRPEELQSHLHTKYNGVKQCTYTIEVERGSTIELHFETMSLGISPFCNQSTYLLLDEMDPFKEDEKPTDSLVVCGRTERKFLVETNKVIVRLMMPSGHLKDDERFELHYQAIGSRCGETINAATGYLQTPNYPRGVRETTHCVWRVQVPKGMRVRVQILDFDNGSPTNRTSSASMLGPFFGRLAFFNDFKLQSNIGRYRLNAPTYIYSSDNRISIDAFLFPQGQHRGFKLHFMAYGTSLCHAFDGGENNRLEFRWPSVGDNSTPYCNYALNPPEHHTLVLQVQYNRSTEYETMAQCRKTRPLQLNRPDELEQLLPYLLCSEDSQKNHTLRLPFPIELIVSIQSRIGSMYLGLSYTLQQCGGMVPLEPGDNLNISRPTLVSSALQAIDCAWAVGPDTTVEDPLSAEDVQLEITISVQLLGDCERHYVNVYAGPDQNSPLVGHYCQGASETNKVVERGLFMEYHADHGIDPANNSTFNVTVRYGSGCGGRLTYPYRVIDFRDQYRNNVECIWDVEAEDGFHIGLTFISRFYIEDSPGCSKDYLLIQQLNETSGNYTDLQKICGRSPPDFINTTSTAMRLIFRSDGNVNGEGFTANFERNCGGTLYATSEAQILSSPNYPRGYGRNLYCNYTFVPLEPLATGVRVAFLTFDLERSPMRVCMYDNVTITTRDSPDNTQESVICGVKLRHVYRAKESISLVLQTDSTFSGSGFQLEYSTKLCGGVVSSTQMIESPRQHQDDQMPHNSDCYWNLTAPAGKKFTLKFELIDFESARTCMYDGVEIFSSPVPDAHRRMARFCGRLTGALPTLHIADNRALIHSFSDERDASRGFRVLVRVLDNCDQTIVLGEQNSSYTFSKFVGQYANNLDCGFVFKAPAGYQLNVEFRSFHVQASTGCTADYLQFSDGAGPFGDDIGRFCGQDLPAKLSSSRHTLFMRFVSDATVTDTGFELLVTATRQPCGNPLIKLDGTEAYELRSPANEQGNYDNNLFCTWKIESENNLHMQFLSLDLEGPDANGSCTADYLKMYDSESEQLLEQGYGDEVIFSGKTTNMFSGYSSEYVYCGKGQPDDYYPNSREVYVKFHSNEAVTAKGFRLRVVPDSTCRHVYGGLQGRVKFAGTADCDVFITVPANYTLSLYFGDVTFGSYDCDDEHVTIYERASNKSLKRVCSYMDASKSFFTQTNDLRLHFKTNSYFTEFDMTYIASSLTAGIGCGGDLYNTQGLFTNAFYPESRRNNSDCRWNIRVPSNTRVQLNFEVFNLGSRATCHTDYLQILETNSAGESQEMRRFCGSDIPHTYQSQRSQLTVRYKKSVNYDGIGWVIKFSGVSDT